MLLIQNPNDILVPLFFIFFVPFLLLMLLALIGIIVRPLTPKEKGHLDPDELAKYAQLGGSGKSVFNSTPPKKQQVGGFLWFS